MLLHHLTILGEPKSQKRHRTVRRGAFNVNYDPSATDKADFLSIVQSQAPDKPYDEPLRLIIDLFFTRPKNHFRSGKNSHMLKENAPLWHISRPDVDNCIKAIFDSLNKVFWRDDAIIAECGVRKRYSDMPRIEIKIYKL
jgi:Holliday junction resolvase RusA-like endonuclease